MSLKHFLQLEIYKKNTYVHIWHYLLLGITSEHWTAYAKPFPQNLSLKTFPSLPIRMFIFTYIKKKSFYGHTVRCCNFYIKLIFNKIKLIMKFIRIWFHSVFDLYCNFPCPGLCGGEYSSMTGMIRHPPLNGSRSGAYHNREECTWIINPGAGRINITFTKFNTQTRRDFLYVRWVVYT